MSQTKKLTEATVPKLTSIPDTALVAVFDPSSGAVSKTDFATLKQAVRDSIHIGQRNFLKNSNQEFTLSGSAKGGAYPIVPLEVGKTYMVTVCLTVTSTIPRAVFSFHGSSFYDILQAWSVQPGERKIISQKVTVSRELTSGYIWISDGSATCHWATVTEGDMPSTGWFPAPEDLDGGG